MLTGHELLWGVVLPLLVGAAALLLSCLPWRGEKRTAPWGVALAVGAAFALAFHGIAGWPRLPPVEVEGWLVYFGLGAVVVGVVGMMAPRAVMWVVSGVMLAVLAWLLLRPRQGFMAAGEFWGWVVGISCAIIVCWGLMEMLAVRVKSSAGMSLLLGAWVVVTAMVLMNSGTQRLAQFAGAVGVVLGTAFLLAWIIDVRFARGGMLAVAAVVLGLLVCGYFYADVKTLHLVLVAVGPLMAWAGQLPGVRRKRWVSFAVAVIAVGVVLAAVMAPTVKGLLATYREQTESTNYY